MEEKEDPNYSIIEYMNDHSGYRCGYCKLPDKNFSHGMWAHQMTASDYQEIINKGWRRSGKYCYKPTMNKTCCPQYAIRCDVTNFKLSKSQKKVLKRMNTYLIFGKAEKSDKQQSQSDDCAVASANEKIPFDSEKCVKMDKSDICANLNKGDSEQKPCRTQKAKEIRRERYFKKLKAAQTGQIGERSSSTDKQHGSKSLEEFLNAPLPDNPAHKLVVRMIPVDFDDESFFIKTFHQSYLVYKTYQIKIHCDPSEKCTESRYKRFLCQLCLKLRLILVSDEDSSFSRSFEVSYQVYKSYQMTIHGEESHECTENTFENFLVDGPLTRWKPKNGPPMGYGQFHQQYWLDDQLIAVGVLDVLPNCTSSVYFYYDPQYSFLSLGTYSSLREIALTRELHRHSERLKWYYMGFYIHSCEKMRYKGNYSPSFLLCPETYNWVPIDACVKKLDRAKYCKLSEYEKEKETSCDVNQVLCLYKRQPVLYGLIRDRQSKESDDEVKQYCDLISPKIARSILLYRSDK